MVSSKHIIKHFTENSAECCARRWCLFFFQRCCFNSIASLFYLYFRLIKTTPHCSNLWDWVLLILAQSSERILFARCSRWKLRSIYIQCNRMCSGIQHFFVRYPSLSFYILDIFCRLMFVCVHAVCVVCVHSNGSVVKTFFCWWWKSAVHRLLCTQPYRKSSSCSDNKSHTIKKEMNERRKKKHRKNKWTFHIKHTMCVRNVT